MEASALTPAAIERYKPNGKRRRIRDARAESLFLIIEPSGRKAFQMRFRRPDGKIGKVTLGPYADIELQAEPQIGQPLSLAAARQLAAEVHRRRALGEDVVADHKARKHRQRSEREERAETTFAACARTFIDTYTTRRGTKPRRWRDSARLLGFAYPRAGGDPTIVKGGLADRWNDRDVRQIDEHDVWSVIKEARENGVPGRGRRNKGASVPRARAMFAALTLFFGWLRSERLITVNPCDGLDRPSGPMSRRRTLSPDEVRWFWAACDAADPWPTNAPVFGPLLRLLLLTGCRRNEVARMARSELGPDGWTIPPERTKNHHPHLVPLSELASAQIGEGDGYVFTTTGTTPVSGFSKMKKRLDQAMLKIAREETGDPTLSVAPWRLHDLRRTFSTDLHALGVAPHVVEATLNHVSGHKAGVAGTYNVYEYYDEKCDALGRWARWVALVVDRDRCGAHQQFVSQGDAEARKKAKKAFLDAISEGGQRWARYPRGNVVKLRAVT